jgi:hypothetical protein
MRGIYYALAFEKSIGMNKRFTTIFSVLIIIVFIVYIIFDTSRPEGSGASENQSAKRENLPDKWMISDALQVREGSLKAVSVSASGDIYIGGESFVSCYTRELDLVWSLKTDAPVTSLSNYGDTIYASTTEMILVISKDGKMKDEWGPFEDNSLITSVSSNHSWIVYADAGNKMVVILDKQGRVERLIGQNDGQFILPSPYFDVSLDAANNLYIANTGHRRIETRSLQGRLISTFGEPGMAPGAFCGCCNPAHFILIPEGFITSEKGINRIKVLSKTGEFVEFVSSGNKFLPSIPLDLASYDGIKIYAANPADSHLLVFSRKTN